MNPEPAISMNDLADASFRRREMIFERSGWLAMAFVLLSACLGIFGHGVLSGASLHQAPLSLRYERFLHFGAITTLDIELAPDAAGDAGTVAVALPNAYLKNFRIESIVPEPESVAFGEQTLFWFTLAQRHEHALIQFRIEPERIGKMKGSVVLNEGQGLDFQQFVYP